MTMTSWPAVRMQTDPAELDALLAQVVRSGASDLHISAGEPPGIRVDGLLRPMPDAAPLGPDDVFALVRGATSSQQWERFEANHELDFGYEVSGLGRFRVNVYQQRGTTGAAFRVVPTDIKPLRALGVPESAETFAMLPRGLVLVTGATSSGKTTTLAAILDHANRHRDAHIVTIEDPIEFVHTRRRSMVHQREVGVDTDDFATALRHALRQDPDIILVGELRDLETMQTAISAAETGHLVLATLHTRGAAATVERLIDTFPPQQQAQIRSQLAGCLQAVISQTLVPRADGTGRIAACEIMVATQAVRNLIREGKAHQIDGYLQSSAEAGMVSLDQHLAQLLRERLISDEIALSLARDPAEFKRLAMGY